MEFGDFSMLGKRMALMAGRLGSVAPNAAEQRDLEWCIRASRCLRGMIDAREALVTAQLEHLIRIGQPAPVDEPDPDDARAPNTTADTTDQPPVDDAGANELGLSPEEGPAGEGPTRETAEEYRRRITLAKWVRRLPLFAEALEQGVITTAVLDGLAGVLEFVEQTVVADVLADEHGLLQVARTGSRSSFVRYLQLRVDTIRADGGAARLRRQIADSFAVLGDDDDSGMHRLFAKLDPLRGQQVATAIRHRADELQQTGDFSQMRRGQVLAKPCATSSAAPRPPVLAASRSS